MPRRIDIPVAVETSADGQPSAFTWRQAHYRVLARNEPWRLQNHWWVTPAEADQNGGKGYSDRY